MLYITVSYILILSSKPHDILIENFIMPKPTLGKKIIFFLALILLTEAVLRIYDVASGSILSPDLFMLFNKGAWQNTVHPLFLYTNRRSFNGLLPFREPGGTFTVETNAHGFRTREFFPKQTNDYRIVILGDSFTYGYNANQSRTYPAVLERLLREKVAPNITVYSLGVPGYSTIQYALLTSVYLDYLKPDLVIVAEDVSDFEEDRVNIQNFSLDPNGIPTAPKELPRPDGLKQFAVGQYGKLVAFDNPSAFWLTKLMFGSSLFHRLYQLSYALYKYAFLFRAGIIERSAAQGKYERITYGQLIKQYGPDFSRALPESLVQNVIPYDLPTARAKYAATFRLLSYIRNETRKRNVPLYFASYPYPWMVSTSESVAYQATIFGKIYDFREDRVPVELMTEYANALGVPLIDAYPVFAKNFTGMYGIYDPHFNEKGYAVLAEVLYEGIKGEVQKTVRK